MNLQILGNLNASRRSRRVAGRVGVRGPESAAPVVTLRPVPPAGVVRRQVGYSPASPTPGSNWSAGPERDTVSGGAFAGGDAGSFEREGDVGAACPLRMGRAGVELDTPCTCRRCPADGEPDLADAGMSTVEYAVGTVVAAAFAAVLYKIVTGDSVVAGLTALVRSALDTAF